MYECIQCNILYVPFQKHSKLLKLKSLYFQKNAPHNTVCFTHIKTPTCFGTQMPFSGSYYNKDVRAKLLIYYLFIIISLVKTVVVKRHKNCKIYKISESVFDNSRIFVLTLCRLFQLAFICIKCT